MFKFWDSATGSCLTQLKLDEDVYIAAELTASSPDCALLAEAWGQKEIHIWDTATSASIHTRGAYNEQVQTVLFSAKW